MDVKTSAETALLRRSNLFVYNNIPFFEPNIDFLRQMVCAKAKSLYNNGAVQLLLYKRGALW